MADHFRIHVAWASGPTISLQVKASGAIKDIKAAAVMKFAVEKRNTLCFHLTLAGQQLEDDRMLADYDMTLDSMLDITATKL